MDYRNRTPARLCSLHGGMCVLLTYLHLCRNWYSASKIDPLSSVLLISTWPHKCGSIIPLIPLLPREPRVTERIGTTDPLVSSASPCLSLGAPDAIDSADLDYGRSDHHCLICSTILQTIGPSENNPYQENRPVQ